jgi:hypothetical protein
MEKFDDQCLEWANMEDRPLTVKPSNVSCIWNCPYQFSHNVFSRHNPLLCSR